MPDPEAAGRKGPDRAAEHARSDPGGESTRREPGPDQSRSRYEHAEAALGGADAVEKTTYVVGEGTEPDRRPRGPYAGRGAATGGTNLVVWVVVGIAVLIALVYIVGLFR
jgi:hypothetical protein